MTKLGEIACPLKFNVDVDTKFDPFTVSAKVPLPAMIETGERVLAKGTGLLTVKLKEPDVPPPGPGLETVTGKLPAFAIEDAGIVTFN